MSIPLTVLPSVASTQDVVHAWGEEGRADGGFGHSLAGASGWCLTSPAAKMVEPQPAAAAGFVQRPGELAFFAGQRQHGQREPLDCRIAILLDRCHRADVFEL